MAYQYCKICALSELPTKTRVRCTFWNKWKRHHNWCKQFVERKTKIPDKIYVQLPSNKWIGKTWDETPIKEGDNPNWKNATNIKYVREDTLIEKACKFISDRVNIPFNVESRNGEPLVDSYIKYVLARLDAANKMIDEFRNYMEGE